MPGGMHKGKCMNSCEQRSVKILRQDANTITIANFRHLKQFWLATIPLNGLESAIYQTQEILPESCPACHSQLRFRFRADNPVVLTSQNVLAPKREVTLTDIVYSIEGTGLPAMQFDVISALLDSLGLSYSFVSLQDRARQMIYIELSTVNQLRLNLSPRDRIKLLQAALRQSDRMGMTQMYNLFERNCTSELFRIIDASVAKRIPATPQFFINLPTGEFVNAVMAKANID